MAETGTEVYEVSSSPSEAESDSNVSDIGAFDEDLLKDGLAKCLSTIQTSGSFAFAEILESAPNPGIHLKEGGTIGLPLSSRDADAIIAASHEAPFGKGEQTIVDTNVRKTWELSADDFELRNPAWQGQIDEITQKIGEGLGIDASGKGVRAQLYKMLVYDEGAMFKAHQDSEKAPRMFGTLVIALPSKHEGGEVIVTHAGQSKTFETSKASEFGYTFLTWFSDVTHEVKPVVSGKRLVLIYNLVHTAPGTKQSASNSGNSVLRLTSLLSRWKRNIEDLPMALAYLFEHEYTDASLCYDALKGNDQQVASHLQEACAKTGFVLYLANLERTIMGDCDDDDYYGGYGRGYGGIHPINDEYETTMALQSVVELSGVEVAKDLNIDEDFFIQTDPFEACEPDDEDFSGFTGNEGTTTTHFYHKTVAIVIPRRLRVEFFLSPEPSKAYTSRTFGKKADAIAWIDRLKDDLDRGGSDKDMAYDDLVQIFNIAIDWSQRKSGPSWNTKKAPFTNEELIRMFSVAVDLREEALSKKLLPLCSNKASMPMFRSLGSAIVRFKMDYTLVQLASDVSKLPTFGERLEALWNLQIGTQIGTNFTENANSIQQWLTSEYDKALSLMPIVSAKDAEQLVQLAKRIPSQDIFNKILPAVKRNVNNITMAMTFLAGIVDSRNTNRSISADVMQAVFKDVISDLTEHISLTLVPSDSTKRVMPGSSSASQRLPNHYSSRVGLGHPYYRNPPQQTVDSGDRSNIILLFCQCLSLGLTAELDGLILRLCTEAETLPAATLENIHLPFLKSLITRLQETKVPSKDSQFKPLYQRVLARYAIVYAGQEPTRPTDWRRQKRGCRRSECVDCKELDRFLVDPALEAHWFTMVQQRRKHLEQCLASSGHLLETDRRGTPQTLVVRKRMTEFESTVKSWRSRCAIAGQRIRDIGLEVLKDLLAELYDPIVFLKVSVLENLIRQGGVVTQEPLSSGSGNVPGPILPPISRRKIPTASNEVIVIDD